MTSKKTEAKPRRLCTAPGRHRAQERVPSAIYLHLMSLSRELLGGPGLRTKYIIAPTPSSPNASGDGGRAAAVHGMQTPAAPPVCPSTHRAAPAKSGTLGGMKPPSREQGDVPHALLITQGSKPQALSQQSGFYYLRPHLGIST